jgi:hypothetical protein
MPRIIGLVLVAFAAYYLLTNPDGAAGFVHSILAGLHHVGDSLARFVDHL